jgi:large subunit ribosomal protein L10
VPALVLCSNASTLAAAAFFVCKDSTRKEECRLPITREKKTELVERYKAALDGSSAVVFTNYKGVSVIQINALRAKLKETGSSCVVVKNTLLGLAFEQLGRTPPESLLNGPNAVIFVGEDIGKSVKALKDWIRDAKVLEITGAVLESSLLDAKQAENLSDLPTKEQTLAMILGTLNAPAGSLVRILSAPQSSLVRVLNAYVEKQNGGEAA